MQVPIVLGRGGGMCGHSLGKISREALEIRRFFVIANGSQYLRLGVYLFRKMGGGGFRGWGTSIHVGTPWFYRSGGGGCYAQYKPYTVRAEIFAVVLFSRVKPSRKFPLQFMSIYSNDNISKIAKLTTRELPHLAKTAKITVRENNGVYSTSRIQMSCSCFNRIDHTYTVTWFHHDSKRK